MLWGIFCFFSVPEEYSKSLNLLILQLKSVLNFIFTEKKQILNQISMSPGYVNKAFQK